MEAAQAGDLAARDQFLIGSAESYALPLLALADHLQIGWTPFIYSQHWVPRLIDYRDGTFEILTMPGVVVREALHNRPHSTAEYVRLWQMFGAPQAGSLAPERPSRQFHALRKGALAIQDAKPRLQPALCRA